MRLLKPRLQVLQFLEENVRSVRQRKPGRSQLSVSCVRERSSSFATINESEWDKILDGIRREGYVCLSYRQRQSVNVRARLITGEKTREAGPAIIETWQCGREGSGLESGPWTSQIRDFY